MENPGQTIKENLYELENEVLKLLEKFEEDNGVKITCIDYKHQKELHSFGSADIKKGSVQIYIEIGK